MALMHVDYFSEVLGMCTQMDVILPQPSSGLIGMDTSVTEGKWKVMYLLHGLSDDHTIWQRRTSIERYVSDKNIAVIMPETQRGWYTDMHYGFEWFRFFTQELPAICRSFFPNISDKREDTCVCGLSMGGYGALKMGMTCPEQYGWAASLSGAVDVAELCEKAELESAAEFEDVFGPASEVRGSSNDLFALAGKLKQKGTLPRLFLCCGLQDGLYWQNVRLRNLLKSLDIPVTYEEENGSHTWSYWDAKIQSVLSWLYRSGEEKDNGAHS